MKAVGYIRVSTEEQAKSGLGLKAQRTAIAKAAAALEVRCDEVYSDEGISGAAPIEKRRGLLAALAALPKGGTLIVAKRDRLSRDVYLSAWLDKEAARRGARIVSAAGEGTDSDDPASMLLRNIVDAFAQFERRMIGARTRAALAAKKAKGERLGGVPLGELAGETTTVARIHALHADGMSLRRIASALTAEGLHPRQSRRWHPKVIAAVLKRDAA